MKERDREIQKKREKYCCKNKAKLEKYGLIINFLRGKWKAIYVADMCVK